jgi:hypothetical protein
MRIGKADPLTHQPVQIGRGDLVVQVMRLDVADAEVIGQDNDNVWRTLRSGEGIIAGKARYGEEEGNKEVHHAAVQHSWAKEDAQAALVLFGKPPSERSNSGLSPVTGEHRALCVQVAARRSTLAN